nr:hypothetical protein [uncultured bacterium]
MKKLNRLVQLVTRSSLLWGGLASLGFYTLIHNGTLQGEFFERYFAAHWVLYAETIMFCVGVASLLLQAFDLGDQRSRLHRPVLAPLPEQPVPLAEATVLAESLGPVLEKDPHAYLPGEFTTRWWQSPARAALNRLKTSCDTFPKWTPREPFGARVSQDHHLGHSDSGLLGHRHRHHDRHRQPRPQGAGELDGSSDVWVGGRV